MVGGMGQAVLEQMAGAMKPVPALPEAQPAAPEPRPLPHPQASALALQAAGAVLPGFDSLRAKLDQFRHEAGAGRVYVAEQTKYFRSIQQVPRAQEPQRFVRAAPAPVPEHQVPEQVPPERGYFSDSSALEQMPVLESLSSDRVLQSDSSA